MRIFHNIGIAGIGLLGGSVALAAKKRGLVNKVLGFTRTKATIEKALTLGVIDEPFEDFSEMVRKTEFMVLCAPISINIKLAGDIAGTKSELLFTDVGSTKKTITDFVENTFQHGHRFCGSHPMAGSEKKGVEFSDAELFSGRTVIITPARNSDTSAVETIEKFWQSLGARVIKMEPEKHDEICAYTSHFPHLLAFLLVDLLKEKLEQPQVKDCIGAGFKDTTRIAASDQEIWSEIFISNRENILKVTGKFRESLDNVEKWIEKNDIEKLKTWIEKIKKLRMEM